MTEGRSGGDIHKTDVQKPLKGWFKTEIQIVSSQYLVTEVVGQLRYLREKIRKMTKD